MTKKAKLEIARIISSSTGIKIKDMVHMYRDYVDEQEYLAILKEER